MKVSRKWLTLAGLLVVAVLAGLAFKPDKPAPAYKTETVARGAVVRRVSTVGTLQPVRQIEIGSQVSGQVADVLVDFNATVKANQVLARLDPTQLDARLRQAEADAAKAKANQAAALAALREGEVTLKDAQRQARRSSELHAKRLISEIDRDTALLNVQKAEAALASRQAALTVAEAGIVQAEASVTDATSNRAYAEIRSPVEGIVVERAVNPGQTLAASFQSPILFKIAEDLREMQLEASVDEADIGAVKVGQAVTFSVDAFPDRAFEGVVRQVRMVPTALSNVVTYTVVIAVDNAERQLLPGMTANAAVEIANRADVLRIPNGALRFKPDPLQDGQPRARRGEAGPEGPRKPSAGRERVFVLEADGRLKAVPVKLGVRDERYTEVLDGSLQAGQAVVVGRDSGAGERASARGGR